MYSAVTYISNVDFGPENSELSFETLKIVTQADLNRTRHVNSQAPVRKSNPQAPVSPCAAISVKERSHSSKISTKVFNGAENHIFTLNSEIYLRNSQ